MARIELKKALTKLGGESITTSKPEMAIRIVQAAQDGIIGEDDAQSTFDDYIAGRVKKVTDTNAGMLDDEGQTENKNSIKANVSKNRTLIKAGALFTTDTPIDFADVLDRAVKMRAADLKSKIDVKPPYDCFVDLAREQLKTPTIALDDEQISEKIRKPGAAEEKTFLVKLQDDHARLVKRANDSAEETEEKVPMQEIVDAATLLEGLIVSLGGEVKKSKAQEKEDEVIAMMIAKGYTVTK
jgi:hypothetical protein